VPSAADYLAAGLKLVAIPRGSKAPKDDDGWQLEQNAIRNVEQASLLAGRNIGVAHLWSGTAAVDVDDYLAAVPWLTKRGIALDGYLAAAGAVQISSGRTQSLQALVQTAGRRALAPDAQSPGIPWSRPGASLRCERWLCDRSGCP
jgi:hypothetical protein